MKKIILCFILLFSQNLFASGKISFKPLYIPKTERWYGTVGFGIYEKLGSLPFAYNGWIGAGTAKIKEDPNWYTTKQQIDSYLSRNVTLSPGVQIDYEKETQKFTTSAYLNFSVTLW